MGDPHHRYISGRQTSSVSILLLRPSSYAYAGAWGDLVDALMESLRYTLLDEMILLLHEDCPAPVDQRSKHVRQISYTTLEEIPQLLSSTTA